MVEASTSTFRGVGMCRASAGQTSNRRLEGSVHKEFAVYFVRDECLRTGAIDLREEPSMPME